MTEFRKLRPVARVYIASVALAGAAVVAHSFYTLNVDPVPTQWLILAALTLLTGSFTVKIPSINAHLSVSETFVFVSVLMFGAAAGTVTVLLECLIILFWMKSSKPVHQILFNTAAPAIAIWVSATAFFAVSEIDIYSKQVVPLGVLFIPLLAFTVLYFLLNSWLVAFALGFEIAKSPLEIWRKNFTWLSVNYFSGASVAALIVTYTEKLDISMLAVIVPLLVVSYLTFRTAMGRVEDTYTHLSDLNKLYLSTIETLAMAIDAKDQITHGHIRRVQAYAVGLARQLGMTDERLIKAIEAAALLHDMGKLAVPEYILNKPGKLTAAEFEKMKLHAGVGADILSAIDFPYPVVPIVRHHHENWDGTGYPTGIKGTDIPIGARILSVVDCFDALTSDRPYRPKLADEEALRILAERRGTMYDPLIVDTFTRVYQDIAPATPTNVPREVLSEITSATQASAATGTGVDPRGEKANALETLMMYEMARELAEPLSPSEAGEVVLKHVRRVVPFAQAVLFLYDTASDEIVARQALGDISSALAGLRMALGQRLSGWVGANRQMILNSDPVLDLGEAARTSGLRLRSCLGAPLISDGQLVGVLTLYSEAPNGFTDEDRRIIEGVALQVADPFKRAVEFENERNTATGTIRQQKKTEATGRYSSKAYR
jgi:putative nucleotidyltransferase with HDIG domain